MSTGENHANKVHVWNYWQKLNHALVADIPAVVQAAMHEDVEWHGSAPINQLRGADAVIRDFWLPLRASFPDIKRTPYVFMGGIDSGESAFAGPQQDAWVSGCGYLTGTFEKDWLGIPATGRKTNIHFGQFYVLREGKIAEGYVMYDILGVMRQAGYQVMPPAFGAEGGKIPGPRAKDGILLTEQDPLESRKTMHLVEAMISGLVRYVRSRDGADMSTMAQEHYWHPDMHWYGPTGIGACLSLEEFQDFHQRPWLHGFGDRNLRVENQGGRVMGFVSEGLYASGGIWDTVFSKHNGEYAGIAATGKVLTLRDFDWWKREGDYLIENWVPIDMIDLCLQLGVDLMERLREQIDARKRAP